jgi:hypothetical protein
MGGPLPRWGSLAIVVCVACTPSSRSAADDTTALSASTPPVQARSDTAPSRSEPLPPAAAQPARASGDTLVGLISEMGADPATFIAIVPTGGRAVRLTGQTALLRRITGAEVWVSGSQERDGFQVARFEVRKVNGRAVDDGIVIAQPDRVAVQLRSGALRSVPDAPPALRGLAGARIWITRPVANQAPSYGVIDGPVR